jgi:hypothetical protein
MDGRAVKLFDRSWNFSESSENESILRPLCEQVETQFQLPTRRLCRYFASTDDADLRARCGPCYRGFHAPVSSSSKLPDYLSRCFFHRDEDIRDGATFDEMITFDNLIYIRHSTYADATGCVETYAHELQHFVQHGAMPRLWRVNKMLEDNLKRLESAAIAIDIPSEMEAIIVSKRVTEIVCGASAVRMFADAQIRLMEEAGEQEQRSRWIFFRDVPSSTQYDLLAATLPMAEKYKTRIEFGIDVDQHEWWLDPQSSLNLQKPSAVPH